MNKLFGIMLLLLSGVVFAVNSATKMNEVSVYTQEKTNIVVTSDSPKFTIRLDSNPTTGYSWFLHEYDEYVVQPIKREFKQGNKKLIGSSGYELWTFKIKPAGFTVPQQTSIRFTYARPWEGTDSSTQVVFRISTQGK